MEKSFKNIQYYKFSFYGFFKNLRFFESFLILFFLNKGLTFTQIGFLYSIRELTIFIFEIPSGVIADVMGRRRTLITAFIFYIVSFVIFYLSKGFYIFALAMIMFAFAEAFRSGVHKAMIFSYLQRYSISNIKADYYGHTRSWSQKGSAISALTAAVFVFITGNYSIIFLASVIPYFINLFLVWSYPKWLDGDLQNLKTISLKEKFIQVERGFSQTFKKIHFLKVLTSLTLYTGYYKAVKDYIQPLIKTLALSVPFFAYLNNDKKTALLIGIFYFFIYLLTSLMSRNSGKFLNLFKNYSKPLNFTMLLGFTAGMISGAFYLSEWYFGAVIGFIIILLIENLRKPIGVAAVADLSHDNAMATVLSLSSQMQSVFAAIIAPLIGFLADRYNPGISIAIISAGLILLFPFYKLSLNKA